MTSLHRIAPITEQVVNSLVGVLLTLVLAKVLTTAEFGAVTFLLIALVYPGAVVDALLGTSAIFDSRSGASARAIRRGTLFVATLAALVTTTVISLAVVAAFGVSLKQPLADIGGWQAVTVTVAVYCMLLSANDFFRRVGYASDAAVTLVAVNLSRLAVLAALVVAVRVLGVEMSFWQVFLIAGAVLVATVVTLALLFMARGELTIRFKNLGVKLAYLARIVRKFAPNSATVLVYGALEVIFVASQIAQHQPELVARYRMLQLALMVVNLLCAAAENSNAARNSLARDQSRLRYRQSVTFLAVTGGAAILGFLVLGKPLITLLFGADLVPTPFEFACGAIIMAAQLARTPYVILLKFDGQFGYMLLVCVIALAIEIVILLAMHAAGLGTYQLLALVIVHLGMSAVLAWRGLTLVREALATG